METPTSLWINVVSLVYQVFMVLCRGAHMQKHAASYFGHSNAKEEVLIFSKERSRLNRRK